ncbi:MAG: hypothetical protein AAF236_13865 [Verrucomicrobiota bacterium]
MTSLSVDAQIENPDDQESRFAIAKLTVDRKSHYSWLSESQLAQIGIEAEGKVVEFREADGSIIRRRLGMVIVRVHDKFAVDEVVFAEADDTCRLGQGTLDRLNLVIDPGGKHLVPSGPKPLSMTSC